MMADLAGERTRPGRSHQHRHQRRLRTDVGRERRSRSSRRDLRQAEFRPDSVVFPAKRGSGVRFQHAIGSFRTSGDTGHDFGLAQRLQHRLSVHPYEPSGRSFTAGQGPGPAVQRGTQALDLPCFAVRVSAGDHTCNPAHLVRFLAQLCTS